MFGWFKKKEVQIKEQPPVVLDTIGWRNNMWVVTPDGLGIMFKLGTESEIHLVDKDGYTISSKIYGIAQLRQATFNEIPKARRGFTKEVAYKLGYK